ncbi:hypothetical protein [Mycobacterium lepromatosis]|uniref:hypothetical protein n=1 Tax=Mycobacterium lepromatosis TaxID=480418 RepID=UPI0005F83C1A|nr:hypothetical protein [Mycobacterium lepromatosis]
MAALNTKFRPDQLAGLANHSLLTALTQMGSYTDADVCLEVFVDRLGVKELHGRSVAAGLRS